MADVAGSLADRIARLRLIRSERIGPIAYRTLIGRFGSATEALAALPGLARRGGGSPPRIASTADAERELKAVERLGARHLLRGLPDYPGLLDQIDDAPAALIVRGDGTLLSRPAVAIVGARNASAAAQRFARQLGADLASNGFAVISGLARGIDGAAHQGALAGGTIAVIAGGIDVVFPPEHADLQDAIGRDGLLVAEMPPGTRPLARHFPRRNRVISGLSLGVVVVEAAPRSGSLITARLAGEQGREVMAVPGSPLDPRARGCNELIRDGATLVQGAEDVAEVLRPWRDAPLAAPDDGFRPAMAVVDVEVGDRAAIVDLIGPVAVPVDELIRLAALPPAIVHTVLLELELAGRLDRHAGGRVSLIG